MAGGMGVCGGLGVWSTARVDESLHDGILSVPASPNSRIEGFSECHDFSCARRNAFANSRSVRGHELR